MMRYDRGSVLRCGLPFESVSNRFGDISVCWHDTGQSLDDGTRSVIRDIAHVCHRRRSSCGNGLLRLGNLDA